MQKTKNYKQKIYNYFGLIEFFLERNNSEAAYMTLKKMPASLKNFTLEQMLIYNIIRARVYFFKHDYAKTVLILRNIAYDKKHIYYNIFSTLYIESLVNLDLKIEACEYFEQNASLFKSILSWDDYNSLAVKISGFLIDLQENEKALEYLKRPLLSRVIQSHFFSCFCRNNSGFETKQFVNFFTEPQTFFPTS